MGMRPCDVAEQKNGEARRVQVQWQEVFLIRLIKPPLPAPACKSYRVVAF